MIKRYQLVKLGTLGLTVENIQTLINCYNNSDNINEATLYSFDQHYDHIIHNHNVSTTMYIMLELN